LGRGRPACREIDVSNGSVLFRPLRTCLLLAIAVAVASGTLRRAGAGEEIAVGTIYLTNPVGDIHKITIRGQLGGTGTILLDNNRCGLNLFGDTTICTRNPVSPIDVRITASRAKDPSDGGRRVYRVAGRYYLTVPATGLGNYRLAVVNEEGGVRVLSLEEQIGHGEVTHAPPPPEPEPDAKARAGARLGAAQYTAIQKGSEITLRARGEHPDAGYVVYFERPDPSANPPTFRLLHEAPDTRQNSGPTAFERRTRFEAASRVAFVIVQDRNGSHRVPVQRAR
jgi:hypothetical protein